MSLGTIRHRQSARAWLLVALVAVVSSCASRERAPGAPAATPAPNRVDQLSFLLGRWLGTRPDGSQMVLEFVRRGPEIIVSSGAEVVLPLYVITLRDQRVVAEAAMGDVDPHYGRLTWNVVQFGADLIAFRGITSFRWRRTSDAVLEQTDFVPEGEGLRTETILLRRGELPEAPRSEHTDAAPDLLVIPAQPPVSYGPFELLGPPTALSLDESWIREHVGEVWGVALRWVSSDRAATMMVTDNGRVLRARHVTRALQTCIHSDFYLQYKGNVDLLSREKLQGLVSNQSHCLSRDQNQAHSRDFDSAKADLDAALAALRTRAETLYGTLERCRYLASFLHPSLHDPNCRL